MRSNIVLFNQLRLVIGLAIGGVVSSVTAAGISALTLAHNATKGPLVTCGQDKREYVTMIKIDPNFEDEECAEARNGSQTYHPESFLTKAKLWQCDSFDIEKQGTKLKEKKLQEIFKSQSPSQNPPCNFENLGTVNAALHSGAITLGVTDVEPLTPKGGNAAK
jgi:hypothetical protein